MSELDTKIAELRAEMAAVKEYTQTMVECIGSLRAALEKVRDRLKAVSTKNEHDKREIQ